MDSDIKLNVLDNELDNQRELNEIADGVLFSADYNISDNSTMSVPISQLASLGAGVASLIPELRTVTETVTVNTNGLYRLANTGVGDVLKQAKNGNYWGAFKNVEGNSKFLQIKDAGLVSATQQTVMPINPAIMMMAVALFSIEQKLDAILEMEKQILSFFVIEKESEIEADVETLFNIISKYKLNWDNEQFITSNHKLVLDIQRTARKNMNSYQKKVSEVLKSKKIVVAKSKVNTKLQELQKEFKYYRMSLYTFSMASLIEIMLSGNFKEEYIEGIKDEIELLSMKYRDAYMQCSVYLEKISGGALQTNLMKGIGTASKTVGKVIGSIPVIKEGQVDEFLQDKGSNLKESAVEIEDNIIKSFAKLSNPETRVFIDKMEDMINIYNHTEEIYFDDEKIYLVVGE